MTKNYGYRRSEKTCRFSTRKFKVGLVSALIAAFYLGGATVAADEVSSDATNPETSLQTSGQEQGDPQAETGQESQPETDSVLEEGTPEAGAETPEVEAPKEPSAFEKAEEEIAEKEATPVVPEAEAQPGDVISVKRTDTDPVTTKYVSEGNTVTETHRTTTIVTTSIPEVGAVKGKLDPVVEVTENVTENNGVKTIERVTKTTTIEYTQDVETELIRTEVTDTDIVFLIDISGSMRDEIQGVKANVATLVNKLGASGLNVRLGLGTYSDESSQTKTTFVNFNGSHFTSDINLFLTALAPITDNGRGSEETPTVGLYQLGTWTDWNMADSARRFVVLLTDEGVETIRNVPTVNQALTSLASKGIELIVIGDPAERDIAVLKNSSADFLNINSNFSDLFSGDLSKTIEKIVKQGPLRKVVTDHYDFALIVIEPGVAEQNKVVYDTLSYKPTSKTLPNTGDASSVLGYLGLGVSSLGMFGLKRRQK